VRNHHIAKRPHVQGSATALRLRHSSGELSDGTGLVLVRRLWDQVGVGRWIDARTTALGGRFRPSLMVEVWVALLFFGGGVMDDLGLLKQRGVRRLFGWQQVPDPTTFGRWLRRSGALLVPLLDRLLWRLVDWRWANAAVPKALTLVLDSTVVLRYGEKQAGAVKGYNPKKQGRPSHHPLVAFVVETGDCVGVRWRPGNAHTAEGAAEWIGEIIEQLRLRGVETITVRLDKGFFSAAMVKALEALGVRYVLKVPEQRWALNLLSSWRNSEKDPRIWTASGALYGARLLACEWRTPTRVRNEDGPMLPLETHAVERRALVLTNDPAMHALTAWRCYNRGALVEQRIEELGQLSVGRTAVDHLDGNRLLWAIGALTYQLLHILRTTTLTGRWRRAQPNRLRHWLLRLPAKLTRHARKEYVQLMRREPLRKLLLSALRAINSLRAPPALHA
jgi:hypothetical protein